MSIQDAEIKIGDYIFLDSPTLPQFLTRRWIEVESKTVHGNPQANLPRMGKPTAGWVQRTFKKSDIMLHKTKAQVETELPRIVSLQEIYRDKRAAWMNKMKSERQMVMQEMAVTEHLPHYDVVRKVILKNMQLVQETGYMRINREVVEELADLFRRGD